MMAIGTVQLLYSNKIVAIKLACILENTDIRVCPHIPKHNSCKFCKYCKIGKATAKDLVGFPQNWL